MISPSNPPVQWMLCCYWATVQMVSFIWMWPRPALQGPDWPSFFLNSAVSLAVEVNAGVPPADEVQGHRSQQQDLLWQRHTSDVCGLRLRGELHQGLRSPGCYWWSGYRPGLMKQVLGLLGPPRSGGLFAGGGFTLRYQQNLLSGASISQTIQSHCRESYWRVKQKFRQGFFLSVLDKR